MCESGLGDNVFHSEWVKSNTPLVHNLEGGYSFSIFLTGAWTQTSHWSCKSAYLEKKWKYIGHLFFFSQKYVGWNGCSGLGRRNGHGCAEGESEDETVWLKHCGPMMTAYRVHPLSKKKQLRTRYDTSYYYNRDIRVYIRSMFKFVILRYVIWLISSSRFVFSRRREYVSSGKERAKWAHGIALPSRSRITG